MEYKYLRFFITLVLLFLLFAVSASAAGLVPCSGLNCEPCDIFVGFANIIKFLVFTITPLAAGIMIVASGLILMFGGTESAKTMGKKMFTNTVIGLVIVFTSWLIINTIITTVGAKYGNVVKTSWNTIQCNPE